MFYFGKSYSNKYRQEQEVRGVSEPRRQLLKDAVTSRASISLGHKGQGTQLKDHLSFNSEDYQFYVKWWLDLSIHYTFTNTLVLCKEQYAPTYACFFPYDLKYLHNM